jgi:hypothetical protein
MSVSIHIDPHSGGFCIGETILMPFEEKSSVNLKVGGLVTGVRDHNNGYEWLDIKGLNFAGEDAALSLCFHNGLFTQAQWSVQLVDALMEGGWPTKVAIDAEIEFVRESLGKWLSVRINDAPVSFPWASVWSGFDSKGFLASNGIRFLSA